MLLNLDTSTDWYVLARKHAREIQLFEGSRVQFDHPCRGMGFREIVNLLGISCRNSSSFGVIYEIKESNGDYIKSDVKDFLYKEVPLIQRACNSSNAKPQCVIKFGLRASSAPCHIWSRDWAQDLARFNNERYES